MMRKSWFSQGLKKFLRAIGLMAKDTPVSLPEAETPLVRIVERDDLVISEEPPATRINEASPGMRLLDSKWSREPNQDLYDDDERVALWEDVVRQQYEQRDQRQGRLHRNTREQRHRPRSGYRRTNPRG